eukprot:6204434-Pleurochrysis_carterae.AAC.1
MVVRRHGLRHPRFGTRNTKGVTAIGKIKLRASRESSVRTLFLKGQCKKRDYGIGLPPPAAEPPPRPAARHPPDHLL